MPDTSRDQTRSNGEPGIFFRLAGPLLEMAGRLLMRADLNALEDMHLSTHFFTELLAEGRDGCMLGVPLQGGRSLCFPLMRSLSAKRSAFFVRILITITPRMYREVLALSILLRRPDFEVLLASPGSLEGRADRFEPHVLVQDADENRLPDGVLCRIRLLDAGSMDATIELYETISEVQDVSLEDLFEVLEEVEELSKGDGARRAVDRSSWDYKVRAIGKDGRA